jgi:hypothetical protein
MKKNQILPYDPALRGVARELRKTGTLGEVLLWRELRAKQLNCEFHREVNSFPSCTWERAQHPFVHRIAHILVPHSWMPVMDVRILALI